LIEILPESIKELKNASTPYGSQIDWKTVMRLSFFFLHLT
jgi:hypothetical protein